MAKFNLDGWLNDIIPRHTSLKNVGVALIENLLKSNQIDFLSVTGRVKDKKGCLEKIKRKSYSDPRNQLTDICGIRIITYFESHVAQIEHRIREFFDIDEKNSRDQKSKLGDDKIGYRSVHFVCGLGPKRCKLPEYEPFKGLKFEVQIRTVLQHAWAELAHDRAYKFSGTLPKDLQRRLNLYSGMLEVVDAGFDGIAKEVDSYKESVERGGESEFVTREIDSITLKKFAESLSEKNGIEIDIVNISEDVVSEVTSFGISNIGELYALCSEEIVQIISDKKICSNFIGMIRSILMFSDVERYFLSAWNKHWDGITLYDIDKLGEKFGKLKVRKVIKGCGIGIDTEDFTIAP